jgi:hypothetical protein
MGSGFEMSIWKNGSVFFHEPIDGISPSNALDYFDGDFAAGLSVADGFVLYLHRGDFLTEVCVPPKEVNLVSHLNIFVKHYDGNVYPIEVMGHLTDALTIAHNSPPRDDGWGAANFQDHCTTIPILGEWRFAGIPP